MSIRKKIIIITVSAIAVSIVIISLVSFSSPVRVTVSPGMTAARVAEILEAENIIRDSRLFLRFIKVLRKDRAVKAGTYYITPGSNYFSIIRTLSRGSEHLVRVTIPEGFRTEQIAERLYRNNVIDDPDKFVTKVIKNDLRGFLFPETYHFPENLPVETVINTMVEQFNRVFPPEWKERAEELGFTLKEIVTLASLIERETRISEERPIISDVFHKRLRIRMYLESCASIQFALGEVRLNLTYNDLDIDSPYNTYRNFGLPPTPIASPGRDSLDAALYPEETEYLFFFEKGGGAHEFSRTYEEHLRKQRQISQGILRP